MKDEIGNDIVRLHGFLHGHEGSGIRSGDSSFTVETVWNMKTNEVLVKEKTKND